MTTYVKILVTVGLLLSVAEAFVVPQQIATILNVIQNTIPQIYKGTDSRVGLGFRFGEHADFQVLLELGPQSETRSLALEDLSDTSKRHANQKTLDTTTERGKGMLQKARFSGVPQLDNRKNGDVTMNLKQKNEGMLPAKNKTSQTNNYKTKIHSRMCNTLVTCLYLQMKKVFNINAW